MPYISHYLPYYHIGLPWWISLPFLFGFSIYLTYKLFTYFLPMAIRVYQRRYREQWLEKHRDLVRMANAYRSIYHLDPNPKDYKKGTGDPKYKEDSTRQCYELCRKFKRGEIPETDVKRCQEHIEEYKRKYFSDYNG